MTEPERLSLDRPRDLGALLSESFGLYRRHFWTFLAMAVVVVVPVHMIVMGVGLGQLSGGYTTERRPENTLIAAVVQVLVVGPLIAVMTLHAVRELAEGRKPRAGQSIQAGLDAFSVVFWPVLIALLMEAATAVTLIIPFILLVRFYFVPQLVVLERKRSTDALRASWELTRGLAWRAGGYILVSYVLFNLAAALVVTPLVAVAQSADSQALALAGTTFATTLVAAPLGIFAALFYHDMTNRKAALAQG